MAKHSTKGLNANDEMKPSGVEWIGEIPGHWNLVMLKYAARLVYGDTLISENREDGVVPVYGSNGIIDTHSSANTLSPAIIVGRKGSLGKVQYSDVPCFVIDTAYLIDRRTSNVNLRWLHYVLQALKLEKFRNSVLPGLNRESAESQYIPLISAEEQTQIANFLDRKTEQIDELIRIKERRIELLQEQRTALINQAVTKGLDPDVEMKPSGVDWIGDIPKDWNAVPLTKYLKSIIDYRGRTPEKTEDGRFLVTARNIRDGQIDYEFSQEFTSEDEYQRLMSRGMPQIGDVLFTTEAPLGEVANVDDVSIALAQRIIKFRPKPDFLNPYFLKYWILSYSFQSDLQRYATGSTARGIKASKLCLLKLNLSSLKEQKQVVEYLDQKIQETNELISIEQRKIELLKEYRQSLISEAVTGKMDVRNEV